MKEDFNLNNIKDNEIKIIVFDFEFERGKGIFKTIKRNNMPNMQRIM